MKLNSIDCEDPDCENEITGESLNDIIWTAKDLGWEQKEDDDRFWWCPPHKLDKRYSSMVWHWKCDECYETGSSPDETECRADADYHADDGCEYRDPNVRVFDHDVWLKKQEENKQIEERAKKRRELEREAEALAQIERERAQRRDQDLIEKGKRYERLWWVRLIETFKRSGVS